MISHLAKLARLSLNQAEEGKLQQQFDATLKVVDKLKTLDTSKTPVTNQVTGQSNVTRQDKIDNTRILTQDQALANAPSTHKGYFIVPRVL